MLKNLHSSIRAYENNTRCEVHRHARALDGARVSDVRIQPPGGCFHERNDSREQMRRERGFVAVTFTVGTPKVTQLLRVRSRTWSPSVKAHVYYRIIAIAYIVGWRNAINIISEILVPKLSCINLMQFLLVYWKWITVTVDHVVISTIVENKRFYIKIMQMALYVNWMF